MKFCSTTKKILFTLLLIAAEMKWACKPEWDIVTSPFEAKMEAFKEFLRQIDPTTYSDSRFLNIGQITCIQWKKFDY